MANDITIIIPVYNRAGIVGPTLAAVAAQTWRPLNVILVDNASTDNTLQVLNQWKKSVESTDFKVEVIEESTPGASAARNAGLRRATTRWTMFFDSDDIMLPQHVEKAMNCAAAHPQAEVIGWDRAINTRDGKRILRRFSHSAHNFNNVFHSIMSTLTYMARTSLFIKAGLWDEKISMGDDIELGQRILAQKPVVSKATGPVTVEVQQSHLSISSENSFKINSFVAAYESVRQQLPPAQRHWVDLRYIVLATNEARDDNHSKAFVAEILKHTPRRRRWLWNIFYKYSLAGGRGVAFLYKPIQWI